MGLEAVINWILSIWRFLTPCHWIAPWEGGVRITYPRWIRTEVHPWKKWKLPESSVVELQPGIHFKVPGLERVHQTDVASQPLNLPPQSLTTLDGRKVNLSVVIMYSVRSVVWFYTRIADQDSYLRDAALGAVYDVVNNHEMQWCLNNIEELKSEILTRIRGNVRGKGYEIESARLSDLQEGRALRLLIDGGLASLDTAV